MALIVKIGANLNGFDKQMRKLTKDVRTVGDKLKTAGATLSAAVTLPVLAMGAAATKTGMDFEAAMSKVAAVSGATGDELQALTDQARELGATTQFSASEAASGMQFLAMAGFKTNDILKAMPGLLDLAAAGALDLGLAADITSNIMSGFGIEAEKAGHISDVLAKASSNANTNVEQLGEAMKYLAPTANTLGWSMEESTAAVMALSDAGIQGSLAGQAFGSSLARLAKPTKEMQKVLDKTKMSFFDANGVMKPMSEVIAEIEKGTKGMTQEQKAATLSTLFGAEAFKHWAVLLDKGSDALEKNTQMLVEADGTAAQMAATMNDNLAGRLKELQSAFEEMAITIYDNLKPALETIVSAVQSVADWFNQLSPSTQNLIIGLAGLAAVVGPLLTVIGVAIILFGQLSAALSILGISMSVALWWVLAIIAALAGIVAVVVYWDQIKAYFITLWGYLKDLFFKSVEYIRNVFQGLYDKANPIIDAIGNALSVGWNFIKTVTVGVFSYISSYIKAVWDAIWFFIGPTVTKIVGKITENWNKAKAITSTVLSAMKTVVTNIFNAIKSTASSVWNSLISIISVPVEAIKNKVSIAFGGMKTTILGVWTGIKTGLKVIINGIIKLINKFIGKFNGPAKLLNKIPGVSAPIIPNIPMLATGGNVSGSGAFITGEAGPELVQKSGSSVKVTPLSSQERAGGIGGALGSNGGKVEIPLYLDGYEIARATYDHINGMLESDASSKLFFSGVR